MRASIVRLFKRFRLGFGATAPKVVVRTPVPRFWVLSIALGLSFLGGVGGYLLTAGPGSSAELEALKLRLRDQTDEIERLRPFAGTGESAANMERATQQRLLAKIALLEGENRVLKEDLLLFERLLPVADGDGKIRVENFRVVHDAGNRARYTLLLAYQPGKQAGEFRGRLQLMVTYRVAGRDLRMAFPGSNASPAEYYLEVRHLLRREGGFDLPDGAELRGVEAQVLQGDVLKAKRQALL